MNKRWWLIGLGLALLLAVLSPLASPHPDGLERVAEDHGFIERALEPAFEIIPDYVFPGIPDERVATIVAGILGTLVLFALAYGLALLLRRRDAQTAR
ncbi:MAG: PDGLE domain-containing protein [Anaerolineae bacterium]